MLNTAHKFYKTIGLEFDYTGLCKEITQEVQPFTQSNSLHAYELMKDLREHRDCKYFPDPMEFIEAKIETMDENTSYDDIYHAFKLTEFKNEHLRSLINKSFEKVDPETL